jgi:cytochrome P450 PksS
VFGRHGIEGRCAFQRWPNLALAVGESEIRWRRQPGIRAIDRLPVVARQEKQRLAA